MSRAYERFFLGSALVFFLALGLAAGHAEPTMTDSGQSGPRKVVVGTTIFSLFATERPYVSLDHRLKEIGERLDEMDADARKRHGRGLDVAVFPENSLNGRTGTLVERSVAWNDEVEEALGAIARKHATYLVVSFNLLEEGKTYNAAVLFDRQGQVAGIYRKVFCLPDRNGETVEGGKQAGTEFPVFATDFGKVGMIICYDMGFDEAFEAYAKAGAELLLWPSMSPQTLLPRLYARRFGFHIVSATPRDNASVFDPLGEIAAQVTTEGVLTHEIDLSSRLVHWQTGLDNGDLLKKRFGDRVGFRFSEREDTGIFWSNDPNLPIDAMLEEAGVLSDAQQRDLARSARKKVLSR